MNKFLKRALLFIGLSILTYPVFIIIYGELVPDYFQKNLFYEKFANGFSNTRFKEVKKVKDVDILFLGSSRAYRHYDPRNFEKAGYSSFNLGSSAQTFLQTEILVNRYLDSLNPRYVILDIYPGMFASDGIESSTDLISNDYNDCDTLELVFKTRNMMVLNTWIYAFYKEYIWRALDDKEQNEKEMDRYISGGYVECKMSENDKENASKQVWRFNEKQWESFTRIIEKLKKSSAKIFIVHSPINSIYKYEGGSKLKRYLESQNLNYYNYRNPKKIDGKGYFYDPLHMNQKGVEIFNDLEGVISSLSRL